MNKKNIVILSLIGALIYLTGLISFLLVLNNYQQNAIKFIPVNTINSISISSSEMTSSEESLDSSSALSSTSISSTNMSNHFENVDKTFTFAYPNNWSVTSNQYNSLYGLDPNEVIDTTVVSIRIGGSDKSAKDWAKSNLGSGYSNETTLTINGYDTYYAVNDRGSVTDVYYVIKHGTVIVNFTFRKADNSTASKKDYSKYQPDFEAMVHSIKFTN